MRTSIFLLFMGLGMAGATLAMTALAPGIVLQGLFPLGAGILALLAAALRDTA